MVTERDSRLRGREFESRFKMLDRLFFTFIMLMFEKSENKRKRGR